MRHHYENLDVWKRSLELSINIYQVLKSCKDYGLKDQMERASVSIPSNIAEGSQRSSEKDFVRFLHIAKGSAAELNTQLIIASRLSYISKQTEIILSNELNEKMDMLPGLIKTLSKRTQ